MTADTQTRERKPRTACRAGHLYDDSSTLPDGRRRCQECRRLRNERRRDDLLRVTTRFRATGELPPNYRHGTLAVYRLGCTCEGCVEVGRTYGKDLYHRRREVDRARANEASREWYQQNREAVRDSRYRLQFAITIEDYNQILEQQGGCCALCRAHETNFKNRLAVDHDHVTGRIRGLLCYPCNTALGRLGDSEAGLRRALAYVRGETL